MDKIPNSFYLLSHKVEVEISDNPVWHGAIGLSDYEGNKIFLRKGRGDNMAVFNHELMHFIFFYSNQPNDGRSYESNESLVDGVAQLLTQAEATAVYE